MRDSIIQQALHPERRVETVKVSVAPFHKNVLQKYLSFVSRPSVLFPVDLCLYVNDNNFLTIQLLLYL